jgi:hypothetical protein
MANGFLCSTEIFESLRIKSDAFVSDPNSTLDQKKSNVSDYIRINVAPSMLCTQCSNAPEVTIQASEEVAEDRIVWKVHLRCTTCLTQGGIALFA